MKALHNRFYVKFMQLEIGLLSPLSVVSMCLKLYSYEGY